MGKKFVKRSVMTILAMVITSFVALGALTFVDSEASEAADLSQFSAGNIISDQVFYDGNALSQSGVQDFLNQRVPNCTINNGQPSRAAGAPWGSTRIAQYCLKNYHQQTPNMAAQPGLCSAYSGSNWESAAAIIHKVGKACNINQKVLLVLLEKEQSLVSDTWPTVRQFDQATGFACYDNGQPCVTQYSGFFYQVWSAARQFQRYGSAPFTWYPVGQVSRILYQANKPECGSKEVLIVNRATAALYYYTPYTPNQAALAAGYGIGDACSAYGNRNFYQLFVDWFGTTQGFSIGERFSQAVLNLGVATTGVPTNREFCNLSQGGCFQSFSNGDFYWAPGTQPSFVSHEFRSTWLRFGPEFGSFGYPTSNASCGLVDGGCWQVFQNGYIYKSSSGIFAVKPAVRNLWGTLGSEWGTLGYPTSNPSNNSDTYIQQFQRGAISVSNGVATVTRTTPSTRFSSVPAERLADTRVGSVFRTSDGQSQNIGAIGPGQTIRIPVLGRGGVPASNVGAVALNVTATGSTQAGFLTVFPSGEALPGTSNLNFTQGQTIPNMVISKVGADGTISIYNPVGSVNVTVDVVGWFPGTTAYTSLLPSRLADTRVGSVFRTSDGQSQNIGAIGPGQTIRIPVLGRGGVPASNVGAVALNVTATGSTQAGFLTVFPSGEALPGTSNLNFTQGQTIPNMVISKVGADGTISIYNPVGSVNVTVDVVGWFPGTTAYTSLLPSRLADTRVGSVFRTSDGQSQNIGAIGPGQTIRIPVLGRGGVPASNVGAVALNVTATGSTQAGFLTVFPSGEALPGTSNLNFTQGQTIPNMVISKVGADGTISIYNPVGSVNVTVDVVGWFPGG